MTIKDHFVSRHGVDGYLIEMDLSQLEVAGLAEITKDPVLIKELNDGVDIHRNNAAEWLRKPLKAVTTEERRNAKVITFQTIYGASVKKIADTLKVPSHEVDLFLRKFKNKYKKVDSYFDINERAARSTKTPMEPAIKTVVAPYKSPTGREFVSECKLSSFGGSTTWGVSPTTFKNYPIQGFATGDLIPFIINKIMMYMIRVDPNSECIFVNTIHDSAMFDVKKDSVKHLCFAFEYCFDTLREDFHTLFDFTLDIDYTYSIKVGQTWGDSHENSRNEVRKYLALD